MGALDTPSLLDRSQPGPVLLPHAAPLSRVSSQPRLSRAILTLLSLSSTVPPPLNSVCTMVPSPTREGGGVLGGQALRAMLSVGLSLLLQDLSSKLESPPCVS